MNENEDVWSERDFFTQLRPYTFQECAARVLGARATMFTSALSRPDGLVTYRLASGKTIIE